jgi:hypothetical protein
MTSLTRRGPYANLPARLPGIQTARITDANVRQAVESLREWVEVRLGARGDRFERAVTFRDFDNQLELLQRNIDAIEATLRSYTGAQIGDTDASQQQQSSSSSSIQSVQSQVTALQTDLASFKTVTTNKDGAQDAQLTDLTARVAALEAQVAALGNPNASNVFNVPVESNLVFPVASPNAVYIVLLDANATIQPPTGAVSGHRYTYVLEQDGVGGRTVAFSPVFKFRDGGSSTVDARPAGVTIVETTYYRGSQFDSLYVTNFVTFGNRSQITGFVGALCSAQATGASTHAAQAISDGLANAQAFISFGDGLADGVADGAAVGAQILSGTASANASATVVGSRA